MVTGVFVAMGALGVAVLLGRLLAARAGIPDAATYVLVGVAVAFVPGVPDVRLSPDAVLLLLLPPLVYFAAFFSDPRETMRNVVAVVGQAVGLVLVTAVAAAATVLALFPDVGWAAALAFGAAIAPPDPVAAGSVLARLGAPRRLVTVLEGEGLVNDGAALTLFAVAASSVGMAPSAGGVLLSVAIEVGGGIVIGLLVGIVITTVRRFVRDKPSQVMLSLLTPFLAFVPAQELNSSGVLATVTAAVWLGVRGRGVVEPTARMQSESFWRTLNLLLVALLFVLLGLQVPRLLRSVGEYPTGVLVLAGAGLVVVCVAVRFAWVCAVPAVRDGLRRRDRPQRALTARERVALGWCGPRGAVSLAVALSLPTTTTTGALFPRRDLLLFLTVVVILATLVGQVLTLPTVLRLLRLRRTKQERIEGLYARRTVLDAALRELGELAERGVGDTPGTEALRQLLELRRDRLHTQTENEAGESGDDAPSLAPDHRDLRIRLLETERTTLRKLHESGEITRTTMIEVSQEIDLDETRLRTTFR